MDPNQEDSLNRIREARERYQPSAIKILFVAEAPPELDSNRFFYFEDVARGDSLFLETMKVLYPADTSDIRRVRQHKAEFLAKFRDDGFFLIDACTAPIGNRKKGRAITDDLPLLLENIRRLAGPETRVILISATVYKFTFDWLRQNGVRIANGEMIDFPGSGGQVKFRAKLNALIRSLGFDPMNGIRRDHND